MNKNTCKNGKRARMYSLVYKQNSCSEDSNKNNKNEFNGKELDIEFNGLKELYKFYGTKSFPPSLKINESKPTINNKRIRKYKLVKVM